MNRQTDRQKDRQIDRQTDRHREREFAVKIVILHSNGSCTSCVCMYIIPEKENSSLKGRESFINYLSLYLLWRLLVWRMAGHTCTLSLSLSHTHTHTHTPLSKTGECLLTFRLVQHLQHLWLLKCV